MDEMDKPKSMTSWRILSFLSIFFFPFAGIPAAVMMRRAYRGFVLRSEQAHALFEKAKRWTVWAYILFAVFYFVGLICLTVYFVNLLSA